MTFQDITAALNCRIIAKTETFDSVPIENIVAGDLMSEVLVAEGEKIILVSSLASDQLVRTAHIVDALGALLVNNKNPQESTRRLAEEFRLNLISTDLPMFEVCAILWELSRETSPKAGREK